MTFFTEIEKISKIYMEEQNILTSHSNPEEKKQS
jgi:hypothetical protein